MKQHSLIQHVESKCLQLFAGSNNFSLHVALSGGIDSVVTLHVLNQLKLKLGFNLSALHVNHGISPNAIMWEHFCQNLCNSLDIPLSISREQITRLGGESLENNARRIRYHQFAQSNAKVIVLAHQQSDQVETVLSQILRGSDLHNIAGMQELTTHGKKILWRPLLEISRNAIEDYALEFKLKHIEDESNSDTSYLRNFLRHEILPRLIKFDPTSHTKILKLPTQLQNLLTIVDEIALNDLSGISYTTETQPAIIVDELRKIPSQRRHNVVASYIKSQNLPLPSNKQLNEFIRQALVSGWDKHPQLKLGKMHIIIKNKTTIFTQIISQL